MTYDLPPSPRTFREEDLLALFNDPLARSVLGDFFVDGKVTVRISSTTAMAVDEMLRGFHVARPRREAAREEWRAAMEHDRDNLTMALEHLELIRDWKAAQAESIQQQIGDADMALAIMKGRPLTAADGGVKNAVLRRADLGYAMEAVGRRYGAEEAERLFRLAMVSIEGEATDEARMGAIRTTVATEHPETAEMLAYHEPIEAE